MKAAAGALALLLALTGCAWRVGAAASEDAWRDDTDHVLGEAVATLGTASVVLEAQAEGRLTQPYVAVTLRDALASLQGQAASYLRLHAPERRTADTREAITTVTDALGVLHDASTAASGEDAGAREEALERVRAAYDKVAGLREAMGTS